MFIILLPLNSHLQSIEAGRSNVTHHLQFNNRDGEVGDADVGQQRNEEGASVHQLVRFRLCPGATCRNSKNMDADTGTVTASADLTVNHS